MPRTFTTRQQREGTPPRREGGPCKLTPEVHAKIIEGLKAGLTKGMASKYAGISHDSLNYWVRRGHDPLETDPRFAAFALDVEATQAKKAIDWLQKIEEAANMDWRAMAWKLERCFPFEYGHRKHLTHEFPEPITVQMVDYEADDEGDSSDEGDQNPT